MARDGPGLATLRVWPSSWSQWGLHHQVFLLRDSCLGWLVPQLPMIKKDAGSLKTSDFKTQSSCRQIQRKHLGHLSMVINAGSWCPDIMRTIIAVEDAFWPGGHVRNHITFLA